MEKLLKPAKSEDMRRFIIEHTLRDIFEIDSNLRKQNAANFKIEHALNTQDNTRSETTADFYLPECPLPPLKRPAKSLQAAFYNARSYLWSLQYGPYWKGTDRMHITADEVRQSEAFQNFRKTYLLRGIKLDVADVSNMLVGRAGSRTFVRLSAEPA